MIRYRYQGARILFVGINPHPGSDRRGVPFSNNKMFWYLLSDAGLLKESRHELKDDASLRRVYEERFAGYALGFVNLIDRPTVDISLLEKGEEARGVRRADRIIKRVRPSVVCFVGKVAYERYAGRNDFEFGWQEPVHGVRAYVMHFPLRGRASVRVAELQAIARAAKIRTSRRRV